VVAGGRVFVGTNNGKPRDTGQLVWQSNLPGDKVIEGQWSNPAYAVIQGKPQVIFAGGDATIYSFEPETGKQLWKFHCRAKGTMKEADRIDGYILATPVVHNNKVYVGLGVKAQHPQPPQSAHFFCIDATKSGDVSPGSSLDPRAADNKNSALVWSYGGAIDARPKQGRAVAFGPTVSTCAIHDGLVYIPETNGYMHCLDAGTGQKFWTHDFKTSIVSSPYYVDGKVYVGTEDGETVIFQAGKVLKIIDTIEVGGSVRTPVVANGVLYLATPERLYAIAGKLP
jgi:outer membrane protein assembly factor BamB